MEELSEREYFVSFHSETEMFSCWQIIQHGFPVQPVRKCQNHSTDSWVSVMRAMLVLFKAKPSGAANSDGDKYVGWSVI